MEIRSIKLSIPSIRLFTYENDYSIWDELENLELYKYKDVQLILDFKWNKFGFKYYYGIWMIHMAFLSCFVATQSDKPPNETRMLLIVIAIILGIFHLYFEIRQFSYNPKGYIRNISNLFDFIAYLLATIISILSITWLVNERQPPSRQLISFSNLLLDLKFILFLRVFGRFGICYAAIIILRILKNISSFLIIFSLIILSFWHAFHIFINEPAISDDQKPDNKINKFPSIPETLNGDNNALRSWSLHDDPYLVILYAGSTLIILACMNVLLSGSLGNDLKKFDKKVELCAQKARIIADFESSFLYAGQHHRKYSFPIALIYIGEIPKVIVKIDGGNKDLIPDQFGEFVEYLNQIKDEN